MKTMLDWLDGRTGIKSLTKEALYESVPGGARWRYVWGSTLTFTFTIQVITGIFLWMAYSPSSTSAWESVYYIQHEMFGGWLLRGIHHYTAQAMNILLVLHLMQVIIDGAYKAPREVNFWFGMILLLIVMGLSLTGYLLPWDQKGYWATQVATNIMGHAPIVGPAVQKIMVGGSEYGHHTLTRFFALHAGVLPGLLIAAIGGHVYLFRKHGLTVKKPVAGPDTTFWPDQVLKDVIACLAVLMAILLFVFQRGAHLGPPADPSLSFSAARPEWYFLFLFQLLKYFPGQWSIVGEMIVPGIVVTIMFAMPLIASWFKKGHQFNLKFIYAVMGAAVILTAIAMKHDSENAVFKASVHETHWQAARIHELAQGPTKIPQTGAVNLLRNDPLTQGPIIFKEKCASCHRFDGQDGMGNILTEASSGADLKGFASREWLTGFLDPEQINSHKYYGGTAFEGKTMSRQVTRKVPKFDDEEKQMLKDLIVALSAEAKLPAQAEADKRDADRIPFGKLAIDDELGCIDCHNFHTNDEDLDAPILTGYGSRDWLVDFISDPTHINYYGEDNDRMPSFGKDKIMTQQQIELVVDWLRGDWYEPEVIHASREGRFIHSGDAAEGH